MATVFTTEILHISHILLLPRLSIAMTCQLAFGDNQSERYEDRAQSRAKWTVDM